MKKVFTKDLVVLWIALGALICAALKLNDSLNKLAGKEEQLFQLCKEVDQNYEKKESDQRYDRFVGLCDCFGVRCSEYACFEEYA